MSEKQSGVDVVVVGSIGIDTIETPSDRRVDILGGSVSYACTAASYFARVGMVGVVGDDFPDEYSELYSRVGIDLAGLQRAKGETFKWSGVYEADMINRKTLSTDLNVFADFSPELPDAYRSAPFLLLGNISPELQLHVFSQADSPKLVLADTMDLWINIARDALLEVISKVDMLTLNDSEARLLTDEHNIRKSADAIMALGPKYVVIKKGEHGAMLFSGDGVFIVPAYPVDDVRDPTGAGDSFAGGFIGYLAACDELSEPVMRKALLYGSVVASFGVEQFSLDRLAALSRESIEDRMSALRAMMDVE